MKNTTASIGIPAFNEEANIKKLLLSLLKQKQSNYILKEIIVVSDHSTDNTVAEIKSVKSKKIKLLQNRKRSGQAFGQNKIIKEFKGDVLVLLNADTIPVKSNFISKLIKPLYSDKNTALTAPKIVPVKGNSFFEDVINFSIGFKDSIFETWNNGNNLYLCSGRGRAFKRDFAKKIKWHSSLSEDAFSYLLCLKEGYKFKYLKDAPLYFKSPDNFTDHLRQSARFTQGPKVMFDYFDKNFVLSEYKIPKINALLVTMKYFIKNPFLLISYISTFLIIKLNPANAQFAKSKWQIADSSKTITRLT